MIKKISASIIAAAGFCMTFAGACTADPFAGYNQTDLEPKTASIYDCFDFDDPQADFSQFSYEHNYWDELSIFYTYEEYTAYGLDLGFSAGFFEENDLLVLLTTSCTSDKYKFTKVLEKDGALYAVISRHKYYYGEEANTDIINWIYYVEVPSSANYKCGEVLYDYD